MLAFVGLGWLILDTIQLRLLVDEPYLDCDNDLSMGIGKKKDPITLPHVFHFKDDSFSSFVFFSKYI